MSWNILLDRISMRVEPGKPRYTVETQGLGVIVACPPRRNWFVLLFLVAWLGGWTVAGASTVEQVLKPGGHQAFTAFWLLGWLLAELSVLAVVLWQLFGEEQLGVIGGNLVHRISMAGVRRTREFTGSQVKYLRVTPSFSRLTDQGSWMPPIFGSGSGAIAFDYGARTYRVGAGLDEAEARQVVSALANQAPQMAEGPRAT